ncbi:MAG: DUF418 domain-containing protein, partial [Leptospiraceae bacterium]|nr:DUF418 domain-containing protein [Leptospiraceae bacterium]
MALGQRNQAIDALRGFALAGILIINIQSFGLIAAAYSNPAAVRLDALDPLIWCVNHLLADQRFMSIFALLFGAGLMMFSENLENKGLPPTRFFFRRLAWLALFGLAHAWLLWYGDILVTYAVCGAFVYHCRHRPAKTMFQIAIGLFLIAPVLYIGNGLWEICYVQDFAALQAEWQPEQALQAAEIRIWRGSWSGQIGPRMLYAAWIQTELLLAWNFWRVSALMLAGMGLYKTGFFEHTFGVQRWRRWALFGIPAGLFISGIGLALNFWQSWSVPVSALFGALFNYFGSVVQAGGYCGLILYLYHTGRATRVLSLFQKIGRSAFSNYILQSLLGTLFFYGHGLGFFMTLNRSILWLVVIGIWAVQLLLTSLW